MLGVGRRVPQRRGVRGGREKWEEKRSSRRIVSHRHGQIERVRKIAAIKHFSKRAKLGLTDRHARREKIVEGTRTGAYKCSRR